mmetsp:Transcript_24118/g.78490  ORF Transcript_24118/g.78490 Transcript_24118/m.78490 type:complete len:171 (-) Transcript_24118:158-670(-)
MTTKTDGETRTILRNLAIIILLFYSVQYIFCMIMAASLSGGLWKYSSYRNHSNHADMSVSDKYSAGLLPFWHFDFGFGQGNIALTAWLTMAISQGFLIAFIYFIVRSTKHAWDYSVTISFIHFVLTCITTRAFPMTWPWWVTIIIATFIVSVVSELLCYFLHDMREISTE